MPTKRNILFITTDQMRFDALGCNGGVVAKTPVIDNLAHTGINYQRAHNQNVVCMPARATIMTGQYVSTHGVWMNGVCLPEDTPTVAHWLQDHGYHTGLLGKAHFEPWLGDPKLFYENRMASEHNTGPHRGFDRMELANHFFEGHSHYDRFMTKEHPEWKKNFYQMVTERGQNTAGAGDTGAIQVWPTDVPKELYHTDWVADRTLNWLSELNEQQDNKPWFCWMSFPDPHHPWDPPASEVHRVNWRDVPLPSLYSENKAENEALLDAKPKHWRGYYDGTIWSNLESPRDFIPRDMTADQVREINAMNHIENELIDDACGRVINWLKATGQYDNTDIIFTTDHGEFQGDFGLLFKGGYHVDALMRLPMIWRPAPSTATPSALVTLPVGHLDLASTFCTIAGIDSPPWVQGKTLPRSDAEAEAQQREDVITEWDSEHGPISLHMKSIYNKGGWLCTVYEKSSLYDGTEGELYDMNADPEQRVNLWNDPAHRATRDELVSDLYDELPRPREPRLPRQAPV
ncbi:MAG: sulfatase-like hydrolase/transferase [Pseudomonadales bacterium]|nr:sulfatase-like hydrolase/transferase [Pseudomonadales bacterium]